MSGDWITSQQVEIYMKSRKSGNTQILSAAKAGFSERSGREIEQHRRVEPKTNDRNWQTRKDPFSGVWEQELIPMLEQQPSLAPITLLEYLQIEYKEHYPDKLLRTLQRRVKKWKAQHGPEKEVMFRQEHYPGLLGLSDFTTVKGLSVTIQGTPLNYILYHFRLAYSHWSYMKVICGGESYTALTEGLQNALWRLGGSPQEHRTDSLSAAFKNMSKEATQDITERYETFCSHYSMKATRNNRGAKHENGSIESPHGHLKRRIEQAFLLRGSYDFDSVEDFQQWLEKVVNNHNQRNAKTINIEKESLKSLPEYKTIDYTDIVARVSSSSTIQVRTSLYTVPSRLIGQTLRIRLYHNRLCCYLGSTHIITLDRVYGTKKRRRARLVNYRHVIYSLVKKPQAFRGSQLRDDLLPSEQYRQIWQYINAEMGSKESCKLMVGLLHLAASEDCEEALAEAVLTAISNKEKLKLSEFQKQFHENAQGFPEVRVTQHSLVDYNQLISSAQEVFYV